MKMTPTERFTDREESHHALCQRIEQEHTHGERDPTWLNYQLHCRITRLVARKNAVTQIRRIRDRFKK